MGVHLSVLQHKSISDLQAPRPSRPSGSTSFLPHHDIPRGSTRSNDEDNDSVDDEEQDISEEMVDMELAMARNSQTYQERLLEYIQLLRDFCYGLEYQLQFNDPRMLAVVEKDGAGMLVLAQNCLNREKRLNSTRGDPPATWEKGMSNALYFRSRPRQSDTHLNQQRAHFSRLMSSVCGRNTPVSYLPSFASVLRHSSTMFYLVLSYRSYLVLLILLEVGG